MDHCTHATYERLHAAPQYNATQTRKRITQQYVPQLHSSGSGKLEAATCLSHAVATQGAVLEIRVVTLEPNCQQRAPVRTSRLQLKLQKHDEPWAPLQILAVTLEPDCKQMRNLGRT